MFININPAMLRRVSELPQLFPRALGRNQGQELFWLCDLSDGLDLLRGPQALAHTVPEFIHCLVMLL